MSAQTTLRGRAKLTGIGLHSGKQATVVLHPAPANHGVVFLRSDLISNLGRDAFVSALSTKVICTALSTTVGNGKGNQFATVATIEHLMAAIVGAGLDNVLVEVDGPEIPILDGSSQEFFDAIDSIGLCSLGVARRTMVLEKRVEVAVGDKRMVAEPYSGDGLLLSGSIEFDHANIGHQSFEYFHSSQNFSRDLAKARTFGFLHEVEYLRSRGLALGGSMENAIVLDKNRILNTEGLRFKNEFVRHKVLDALGDLALLGIGLRAKISAHKAGHELHVVLARKILEDASNYRIVEAPMPKVHVEPSLAEIVPLPFPFLQVG